jgi:hypothetical protein
MYTLRNGAVRPSIRRTMGGVRVSVVLLGAVTGSMTSGEAGAAARKPKTVKPAAKPAKTSNANYAVAIRTDALTTTPVSSVDYTVLLTKGAGIKGAIQFDVPDLPASYRYSVTQLTTTSTGCTSPCLLPLSLRRPFTPSVP